MYERKKKKKKEKQIHDGRTLAYDTRVQCAEKVRLKLKKKGKTV